MTRSRCRRLRLRVSVVWSMASAASSCRRFASPLRAMARDTELRHPEPARPEDIVVQLSDGTTDMRSVLHTHGIAARTHVLRSLRSQAAPWAPFTAPAYIDVDTYNNMRLH